MRKLWLLFSQSVTVFVAAYFVVATLKPEWLDRRSTLSAVSVIEAPAGSTQRSAGPNPGGMGSFSSAAKIASAAVVSINTSKAAAKNPQSDDPWFKFFFGDQGRDEPQGGLGSGVIISASGYILTNNHVVEGADEIEVILNDSRKAKAKVIGTDPDTDLAILKIDLDKLPVIVLGNSDALLVGDPVLAIGNPFGVGQTVTGGIVSALGRNKLGINTFENFIQTDAAINPGNSGGALVDASGNLIGINTAIYSRSGGSMGIGFAIPVSTAKQVMESIIKTGSMTRGWIGVEVQEISPALAESFKLKDTRGAIIAGVLRNGPADKAGVKPGDVLLGIEDKVVTDPQNMLTLVAGLQPGAPARLKLRRGQEELEVKVLVGKRPKPQPEKQQ